MNKTLVNQVVISTATAAAVVITVILFSKVVGPLPLTLTQHVTETQQTFDVTGEAEIETIPDEAAVTLGITTTSRTVAAAQEEANRVINSITEELKSMGISDEDIKTQNYSINPEYSSVARPFPTLENGQETREFLPEPVRKQEITGYRVAAQLRVTVTDFEKLNEAIDMASEQGANQVGSISFGLSSEKEAELKEQAREEAIADAKDSAKELAKLAGLNLGKVTNVTEGRGYSPQPYMARSFAESADMVNTSTSIEPGSTTYNYNVTLSYQVK